MPIFSSDLVVPAPVSDVFEFFIRPANLLKISPPQMGLKFIDVPPEFEHGVQFEFAVQTFGIVQKVTHRITMFNRPDMFVEELVKGPVPKWIHTHQFVSVSDTETKLVDRIEFEPPGGIVGMMLTEDRIHDHLDEAFFHRSRQISREFAK
ncbi:SRPBCC family protein [Rubinisphaera margarita]|uniref:SRPBCC family protein n=1 Tax=Rubinisphaera margarita TaxID=2909586 RepID=UPI001EE7F919|nr:SRPBCC family protein [Rubinisphaera margarita]MCG6157160.1 SRPBCC family protein [Rubinisphaera margarita]